MSMLTDSIVPKEQEGILNFVAKSYSITESLRCVILETRKDNAMNLDEIICAVLNGELEFGSIPEYFNKNNSPEDLRELKETIDNYDIPELYEVLFERFSSSLDTNELQYYIEKCRKNFDEPFCDYLFAKI